MSPIFKFMEAKIAVKAETKIVRDIIDWFHDQGGDAYHVHGSSVQRTGEPDIDGWVPLEDGSRAHCKVEVKTATGTPSNIQLYRLACYRYGGYYAGVVTCVEDVMHLLENKDHPRYIEDWLNEKELKAYAKYLGNT